MKPPPRKRTKTNPSLQHASKAASEPQRVSHWTRCEQQRLLRALRKLDKNEELDYTYLTKSVRSRSCSEVNEQLLLLFLIDFNRQSWILLSGLCQIPCEIQPSLCFCFVICRHSNTWIILNNWIKVRKHFKSSNYVWLKLLENWLSMSPFSKHGGTVMFCCHVALSEDSKTILTANLLVWTYYNSINYYKWLTYLHWFCIIIIVVIVTVIIVTVHFEICAQM